MNSILRTAALFAAFISLVSARPEQRPEAVSQNSQSMQDSVLRHLVLFKFKEGTNARDLKTYEQAFEALQEKIPQIMDFEWGLNNSPEGLDKGFTHGFLLTFKTEADRAGYLPHPEHKAFENLIGPAVEDVLVLDYWTR